MKQRLRRKLPVWLQLMVWGTAVKRCSWSELNTRVSELEKENQGLSSHVKDLQAACKDYMERNTNQAVTIERLQGSIRLDTTALLSRRPEGVPRTEQERQLDPTGRNTEGAPPIFHDGTRLMSGGLIGRGVLTELQVQAANLSETVPVIYASEDWGGYLEGFRGENGQLTWVFRRCEYTNGLPAIAPVTSAAASTAAYREGEEVSASDLARSGHLSESALTFSAQRGYGRVESPSAGGAFTYIDNGVWRFSTFAHVTARPEPTILTDAEINRRVVSLSEDRLPRYITGDRATPAGMNYLVHALDHTAQNSDEGSPSIYRFPSLGGEFRFDYGSALWEFTRTQPTPVQPVAPNPQEPTRPRTRAIRL